MQPVRLSLEPWRSEGPTLTVAAVLQHPDDPPYRLWWRVPAEWRDALTPWADPFVVAFLFSLMQGGRDVIVEGSVSPSLLANLEQYMVIWQAWEPELYRPVEIRARDEVEAPPPIQEGQTIVPFSCGVDSSFTLYRHRRGLVGRRTRQVGGAMVMHGFDIWLDQENGQGMYEGLLGNARAVLGSLDVPCIPVAGNFHELPPPWAHSLGTHLVGGLRLFAGRFAGALIPNDVPHARLHVHWGSHPVLNPLLGSAHFQVIDDGGEAARFQKIQVLSQWPEAMRYLRVCFENRGSHANCCRCEKCIRTILSFRAAGLGRPPSLPKDVTDRQIRRMRFHSERNARQWLEVAGGAEGRGLGRCGWVLAVHAAVRRNQRRWRWRWVGQSFIPLRNCIRRWFRGSPLSRRELAAQGKAGQAV